MARRVRTAEISISRYLSERTYEVQTNDRREAKVLTDAGWVPTDMPGPRDTDGYFTFKLPLKAVLIRKRSVVEGYKNRNVGGLDGGS